MFQPSVSHHWADADQSWGHFFNVCLDSFFTTCNGLEPVKTIICILGVTQCTTSKFKILLSVANPCILCNTWALWLYHRNHGEQCCWNKDTLLCLSITLRICKARGAGASRGGWLAFVQMLKSLCKRDAVVWSMRKTVQNFCANIWNSTPDHFHIVMTKSFSQKPESVARTLTRAIFTHWHLAMLVSQDGFIVKQKVDICKTKLQIKRIHMLIALIQKTVASTQIFHQFTSNFQAHCLGCAQFTILSACSQPVEIV